MEPKRNDWHAAKCIQPTTNLPIEQGRQNPIGLLRQQGHEPIQVVEQWEAQSITELPNNDYVVDFGQNFAGIFEFTLSGKRGQTLKFQTSEQLNPDGTVNAQDCYCGPIVVYDTYTFGSDGVATWSPELMYHGFRYLQVSGLTSEPKASQFKALRMRVSCDAIGHFETSNTLINQIHRICRNSIESQLFHVFTDCPQREKTGWLDVPNQMYNSIAQNFDFRRLGYKIVRDCFDAQAYYDGVKYGKVPSTVPHFFTDWDDDPNWGGSAILIPYRTWKTYGDHSLVDEYYDEMKRLADYYTSLTQGDLMPDASYSRLSDWGQESSGLKNNTVPEFTITCTYYYIQKVMAEMAHATRHKNDAISFEQQAERTRKAFNTRYYNDSTAIYAHGNQAELAMPLYYGLTDTNQIQRVADRLAERVIHDGFKVKTGECGLKPVLMSLAQYGHNDIVWQMACQTDYPSYGYFVKNGCTTTPELWNMRYSQNHCMLDHIEEWFYSHLAGIQNVGTGYDHILLQPYTPEGLDTLKASIKTPHGIVTSEYQRLSDGSIHFHFSIPQGSTATIQLPNGTSHEVGNGDYSYTCNSPIGEWKRDKAGLPSFEYAGSVPFKALLAHGDSVKPDPDPWFVLGNYQITVFTHVSGQYELITGQRAWARMNQGDSKNTGKNDARLEVLSTNGKVSKVYPLVGMGSLSADSTKSKRTFGCGYAQYQYQADKLQVSRTMSVKPSPTIDGGTSAFLLTVSIKNNTGRSQRLRYVKSIRAQYETIMQQSTPREWRKVKYTPEIDAQKVEARFKAETDDPMLFLSKDDISKYEGFPPVLYMEDLTGKALSDCTAEDLGLSYDIILHDQEEKQIQMIIGFDMERDYAKRADAKNELKGSLLFSEDWKKLLPDYDLSVFLTPTGATAYTIACRSHTMLSNPKVNRI